LTTIWSISKATYPYLPKFIRYVVSDGFYGKIKWVNGVALKLDVISKLRCDADLRYVYTGVQASWYIKIWLAVAGSSAQAWT
jgi:hypothetical protein